MEEVAVFLAALNPYGLLNWLAAAYCGYVYNKIGNGVTLFLGVLNVVFGIVNIVGN